MCRTKRPTAFATSLLWILCLFALGTLRLAADDRAPEGVAQSTPAPSPSTGTVEGTVVYQADRKRLWRYSRYYIKDRRKGALAESVVELHTASLVRGKAVRGNEAPKTIVVDQKDHQFVPETVVIRAGDRVQFLNSDHALHNVASYHPLFSFNVNMPVGSKHVETFKRASGIANPYELKCGYHTSMRAWVFVFKHPYFQLTEADGKFRFENVPPGQYELKMVHPAGNLAWSQAVDVKAGEITVMDIQVSPDNLQKAATK